MRLTARRRLGLLGGGGVAALIALNAAMPHLNPFLARIVVSIGINVILAVSLNLIAGFTGQLNLGHAGFMAVGAYLSAGLTYYFGAAAQAALGGAGVPQPLGANCVFLAALLTGAGAAALCGLLVGLPTLRLRGDYLAIATLGFGEIIRIIIVQLEVVGAARGFSGIPQHTTFLWVYGWAALTIVAVRNLAASAHGRALAAVREDEMAAQVMGVDTVRYKVAAFTIGAFFAGAAGALFAHYPPWYLNPATFSFMRSIEILLMVVLGGMGSIAGSVAGAAMLTVLPEALRTPTGVIVVAYCVGWAVLLLPCLRRPGAARRLGAAALALGVATVFAVLTSGAEVTPQGRGGAAPWLGLAMLALGAGALVSLRRRRWPAARLAAGVAAGAVLCIIFWWPQILPGAVGAARDWLGQNVTQLRMVIYAVLLITLMLARPQGIFGKAELTWRALRALLLKGKGDAPARA